MSDRRDMSLPPKRLGRRPVTLSLSLERLDYSWAYVVELSGDPSGASYNEVIGTVALAQVDVLNADGWYLQHIEELERLALELQVLNTGKRSLPSLQEIHAQLAGAQKAFTDALTSFKGREYSVRWVDVLMALGAVLFYAVLQLRNGMNVKQFFEVVTPATNEVGVTLQQAFAWAALPQYRYALFKRKSDPTWGEHDLLVVHRQLCQVIEYVVQAWLAGEWLDPGDFGPLGRVELPVDTNENE